MKTGWSSFRLAFNLLTYIMARLQCALLVNSNPVQVVHAVHNMYDVGRQLLLDRNPQSGIQFNFVEPPFGNRQVWRLPSP